MIRLPFSFHVPFMATDSTLGKFLCIIHHVRTVGNYASPSKTQASVDATVPLQTVSGIVVHMSYACINAWPYATTGGGKGVKILFLFQNLPSTV